MSYMKTKIRKKSLNKISFDKVESFRRAFDFKVFEMAEMLGFTTRQYSRCKNQGRISACRYYALKDAMMTHILQESHSKLELLSKI